MKSKRESLEEIAFELKNISEWLHTAIVTFVEAKERYYQFQKELQEQRRKR